MRHLRKLVAAAMLLGLPACGRVDGLAFREDTRVDVTAPRDRQKVSLPVTVRWNATGVSRSFGVFVDRAPQPPGKPMSWFARNDEICKRASGCPDARYLADRNVFTTDDLRFTVDRLNDTVRDGRRREFHEVTIVLLDSTGKRIGESAWSVEFQVERVAN